MITSIVWFQFPCFIWIRLGNAAVTNNINFILMLVLCIRMGLLGCSDWKIILESHAKTINYFKLKTIHTTSSDIS